MKKLTLILLVFCAFTTKAQNIILNGSFEINTSTLCFENLYTTTDYNNTVNFSSSYGYAIALFKDSCLKCNPPTYWGGGAQEGHWFIALTSRVFYNQPGTIWVNSKFSLQLDSPLSNEKNYKLSFYIKEPPDIPLNSTGCLESPSNYIQVGISNNATNFGTHIYTSPIGLNTDWQQYSIVFNTQNEEEYITVEVGTGDTNYYGIFVDNFVLEETTEPVSVQEVNSNNKQLLKIVDVLGKEVPYKKNVPLFYMYSDGTVEKKLIIE
jgi:hypothetical protein